MLGIDIQQILLHLLNFVILFTGLYVLLYGPVKKFMDKRTEEYKKMDEDAEEKLANATNLEAEYKEKLSAAEATIADMKKKASVEIDGMRSDQAAAAKEEAAEILAAARKTAEIEKAEILESAKGDITRIVEEAAAKMILSSETTDVYDAFLKSAERSTGNGTGA
ncbi:MAG: ATP synthase F0 subunit B [Eubacterium sp.]|nr:ATP synthase F0 subunit B [Eubacterium sp.]